MEFTSQDQGRPIMNLDLAIILHRDSAFQVWTAKPQIRTITLLLILVYISQLQIKRRLAFTNAIPAIFV